MTLDLSILIVHYNTPAHLDKLLAEVSPAGAEIIVVDNASVDPPHLPSPNRGVTFLNNDANVGYAAAVNQAYAFSSGRYVMALNPDTSVPPEGLAAAVDWLGSHPGVAMVGPHSSIYDFPPVRLDVRQPGLLGARVVDWLIGTGLIVRREALGRDRLFDDSLFLFGEELELAMYLRGRGHLLVALPELVVHHDVSSSVRQVDPRVIEPLRAGAIWRARRRAYGRGAASAHEALVLGDALRRRDYPRGRIALGLLTRGERYVRAADVRARRVLG